MTENRIFTLMSYDNLSSVSQNVLKFYQQLTGEERKVPFILVGTISNVLVMEIGWTDVGSGGYTGLYINIFFNLSLRTTNLKKYLSDSIF